MIDIPKLEALLSCATDIWTVRIPQFRMTHGVGEEVERNVANMLMVVANCLDQSVQILKEGQYEDSVAHISGLVRRALAQIEDCHEEAAGWAVANAVVEAAKSTKH
ncbi:hypothetical protein AWB69_05973 [Caballeronia udeis]|uniref:Uncharacterized protein n=1 Tax=Caballeronia udeis TaxID=1232866 RepID=A0A158IG79_9BURK|nr:hypothetical protein [Caballeronia udeis]SAL55632.1 hypothetical protein AWB69_05973 [Caballeronia udeis]